MVVGAVFGLVFTAPPSTTKSRKGRARESAAGMFRTAGTGEGGGPPTPPEALPPVIRQDAKGGYEMKAAIRSWWRRQDIFDVMAVVFMFVCAALILANLSMFPVYLDIPYHMAVTRGFREAGGVVTWDFWDAVPAGRPHIYPPLLHVAMSMLEDVGFGVEAVATLACVIMFPLILVSMWWAMRKLFGPRAAFYSLVLLAVPYAFFYQAGITIAASLVLVLTPLLFLALEKSRKVAAALLLALCLYSHLVLGHLTALALFVYMLHRRDYWKRITGVLVAAYLLYLPWGIVVLSNLDSFSVSEPGMGNDFSLHVFLWGLAAAGVVTCYLRRRQYFLLPAYIISMVPIAFFYPHRFWEGHVFLPLAMLGGVALDRFHAFLRRRLSGSERIGASAGAVAGAALALLLAAVFFADPVIASPGGARGTGMQPGGPGHGGSVPRPSTGGPLDVYEGPNPLAPIPYPPQAQNGMGGPNGDEYHPPLPPPGAGLAPYPYAPLAEYGTSDPGADGYFPPPPPGAAGGPPPMQREGSSPLPRQRIARLKKLVQSSATVRLQPTTFLVLSGLEERPQPMPAQGMEVFGDENMELMRAVEENSEPGDAVLVGEGRLGDLIYALTGRYVTQGMFHEVQPEQQADPREDVSLAVINAGPRALYHYAGDGSARLPIGGWSEVERVGGYVILAGHEEGGSEVSAASAAVPLWAAYALVLAAVAAILLDLFVVRARRKGPDPLLHPPDGGSQDGGSDGSGPVLALLPARNEEENIASVVKEIDSLCPGLDILVVDDASGDCTGARALAEGAMVMRLERNLGVGEAERRGLAFALARGYSYAVRLDGDGQHPARHIHDLLRPLEREEADVVVGSRFLAGRCRACDISMPRRLGISYLRALMRRRTGIFFTDPTSGFRAYSRAAMRVLVEVKPRRYPEASDLLTLCAHGFRLRELAVEMRPRAGGKSSIGAFRGMRMLAEATVDLARFRPRGRRQPGADLAVSGLLACETRD